MLIEFENFYMALNLEMTGSGSKRVDRLYAGIECNGCQRVFATLFMTNTDEVVICATLHYALPNTNRMNLYAVSRTKMSTASLGRRSHIEPEVGLWTHHT